MMPPQTIEVSSLGFENSLLLMVLALVVFGPRRLPEIGRQIGKLMYEIRKASNDFKFQLEDELRKTEEAERRSKEEERGREQGSGIRDQIPASEKNADFQIPESAPEAPTAIDSPYPGEGVYPEISPAEFQHDEPYPRIQPPSTGEPVAAARPGSGTEQTHNG
ncbi:MAG: twin-arginine translocase TatA/TatE family subunit [Terracidiphilus sp.]|jgi:sec-independent protein translocase protein TatB